MNNKTNRQKTQHTPGEWYTRHGQISSLQSSHGETIAIVNTTSKHISNQESAANANLIAAAPDMLSTLRDIRAWLTAPDLSKGVIQAYCHDLDLAIAKATEKS